LSIILRPRWGKGMLFDLDRVGYPRTIISTCGSCRCGTLNGGPMLPHIAYSGLYLGLPRNNPFLPGSGSNDWSPCTLVGISHRESDRAVRMDKTHFGRNPMYPASHFIPFLLVIDSIQHSCLKDRRRDRRNPIKASDRAIQAIFGKKCSPGVSHHNRMRG